MDFSILGLTVEFQDAASFLLQLPHVVISNLLLPELTAAAIDDEGLSIDPGHV